MSAYPSFPVYTDNGDNTITPLANHVIKVYDATNGVALADVETNANGQVAAGTLAVAGGTLVRFSVALADLSCGYAEIVTDSGVGMDLVIKPSGGQNIVLRPAARPTWYRAAEVEPVEVEVLTREIDEDGKFVGVTKSLGRFPIGRIVLPNNPDTDRNRVFYFISYAADGTPDVASVDDAKSIGVPVKRETAAPTIGQDGAATADAVKIGITGFTRFARQRRIRVADNPEMTNPIEIILNSDDYVARELPKYFILERELTAVMTLESGDDLLTEAGAQIFLEQ